MGLGAGLASAPTLDALSDAALHCWAFCGGWVPERWPIYEALYPVADWHQLIDAMSVIRAKV